MPRNNYTDSQGTHSPLEEAAMAVTPRTPRKRSAATPAPAVAPKPPRATSPRTRAKKPVPVVQAPGWSYTPPTTPPVELSLHEIFDRSRDISQAAHATADRDKRGVLRGGNAGIMDPTTGEQAGSCGRMAHLRSIGLVPEQPDTPTLIMFSLGFASEDIVAGHLDLALPAGWTYLREEEVPISWTTSTGVSVTGRPDVVLFNPAGVKQIGMELKSVHSVWVAREVLINRHPKLANLVQSAHYMWALDLPQYKLVYSSYSQLGQGMGDVDWMRSKFPAEGEPGSEYLEWSDQGKIKHLKQFEVVYDLRFTREGRLQYKLEWEPEESYTTTIVTVAGIRKYYEHTGRLGTPLGALGPRPSQVDAVGAKASYSLCQYCVLNKTCRSTEKFGYDTWLDAVRKEMPARAQEAEA